MGVLITSDNKRELGRLCRDAGLIADGTESLPSLVANVLHQHLPKPAADRISAWDDIPLSESQIAYAAADAVASLRVYEVAASQPDLTIRCKASQLSSGVKVDIVPSSSLQMSTVMADAKVVNVGSNSNPPLTWTNPLNGNVVKVTKTRCVVLVEEVHAPSYQLKSYMGTIGDGFINKRPCKLGDFVGRDDGTGTGSFEIVIDMHNLAPHSATRFRPLTPPRMDADSRDSDDAAQSIGDGSPETNRGGEDSGDHDKDDVDSDDDSDDDDEDARRQRRKELDRLSLDPLDRSVKSQLDTRRAAMAQIAAALSPSDNPAEHIEDVFVSWPGDIFHAFFGIGKHISRKHAMRRPFLMSLRDACLIFDEEKMKEVLDVLQKKFREQIMQDHEDERKLVPVQQELDRLVDLEIQRKKEFEHRYFTRRVPRRIPAPSVLIPRVKAVVAAFADMTDTKTKKPLFDDKARKKVDAFIAEIKLGHYSDMPGVEYYKYKLDKKGRPLKDEDGLGLLKCDRGTNDVEATHRVINKMLGSSSCGEEFADCWASERRHRYNHDTATHTRQGYPKTGHYKHWLIDRRQQLSYAISGRRYLPHWINALEMADTPESFGIVPLSSVDLQVPPQEPGDLKLLSRDQLYIARQMHCTLPPGPVQQRPEQRLFIQLYHDKFRSHGAGAAINFRRFAEDWNMHASAKSGIMPKLPVHLRLYFKRFLFNSRLKDMLRAETRALSELRTRLASDLVGAIGVVMPAPIEQPLQREDRVTVDVGTARFVPIPPSQAHRNRNAEQELHGRTDMDANTDGGQNFEQELDDAAEDEGAASEPRKRQRNRRQCALCLQVVKMLNEQQIRSWLGDRVTLQPGRCRGKGTGEAGVSNCPHFTRIAVFTDASYRQNRARNNALCNIASRESSVPCPFAANSVNSTTAPGQR